MNRLEGAGDGLEREVLFRDGRPVFKNRKWGWRNRMEGAASAGRIRQLESFVGGGVSDHVAAIGIVRDIDGGGNSVHNRL